MARLGGPDDEPECPDCCFYIGAAFIGRVAAVVGRVAVVVGRVAVVVLVVRVPVVVGRIAIVVGRVAVWCPGPLAASGEADTNKICLKK